MREQYSTLDICKALGITRERLRDWMNRGFIKPSIQEAKGQGTKALFSRNDVYLIMLFLTLIWNGINRKESSGIIQDLGEDRKSKDFKTFMESDFLLFRSSYFKEKRSRAMVTIDMYKGNLLDVETAMPHIFYKHKALKEMEKIFDQKGETESGWIVSFIVNFNTIKKDTDAALSIIEE